MQVKGWEYREFIKERYEHGYSLKKVANQLSHKVQDDYTISPESVKKVLKEMGVKIRLSWEQRRMDIKLRGKDEYNFSLRPNNDKHYPISRKFSS